MATTPLFALTPAEQKILDDALATPTYTIDYKSLCSTKEGREQADAVNPALDTILGDLIKSVYDAKTDFSKKRNSFETETYNSLTSTYSHLQKSQELNSNNWSGNCFANKR